MSCCPAFTASFAVVVRSHMVTRCPATYQYSVRSVEGMWTVTLVGNDNHAAFIARFFRMERPQKQVRLCAKLGCYRQIILGLKKHHEAYRRRSFTYSTCQLSLLPRAEIIPTVTPELGVGYSIRTPRPRLFYIAAHHGMRFRYSLTRGEQNKWDTKPNGELGCTGHIILS